MASWNSVWPIHNAVSNLFFILTGRGRRKQSLGPGFTFWEFKSSSVRWHLIWTHNLVCSFKCSAPDISVLTGLAWLFWEAVSHCSGGRVAAGPGVAERSWVTRVYCRQRQAYTHAVTNPLLAGTAQTLPSPIFSHRHSFSFSGNRKVLSVQALILESEFLLDDHISVTAFLQGWWLCPAACFVQCLFMWLS